MLLHALLRKSRPGPLVRTIYLFSLLPQPRGISLSHVGVEEALHAHLLLPDARLTLASPSVPFSPGREAPKELNILESKSQ